MTEDALVETVVLAKRDWERTFDAILDPVTIVGLDYRLRRCNRAAASQAGGPVQGMPGQICHQALFDSNTPCVGCPLGPTVTSGLRQSGEVHGVPRIFQVHTYPLSSPESPEGPGGGLEAIVCWYRDVTEQRRLLERLLHTERLASLGTLAEGMSHEINNPLATISTWTQMLIAELPDEGDIALGLREIREATARCRDIVRALRTFARSHEHEELEDVDLGAVVSSFLRITQGSWAVPVEAELQPGLPSLRARLGEIQTIVSNLVSNAVHATQGRPGRVVVRTRLAQEGLVSLEVEDEGRGMDGATLSRIFQPFFTTGGGSSSGLGLSVTLGIVEAQGGRIEVQSELDAGSRFVVTLPCAGPLVEPERSSREGSS